VTAGRTLRSLGDLKPLYTVPGDDLVGEVLIPSMAASSSVRCMAGFFSSAAFRHIAFGLAAFINDSAGSFRLLISPILSEDDRNALRDAIERPEAVLARAAVFLFEQARISPSALEQHALGCLSYLLATGRLEIRFVLMAEGGMFHPKVWIFRAGDDVLVAHGSSNPTVAGLLFNFEAVSVDRTWTTTEAATRAVRFAELFETLWAGKDPDTLTIELPQGLVLAKPSLSEAPTIADFWRAWHADAAAGLAPPLPRGRLIAEPSPTLVNRERLRVPRDLVWEHGPFGHQAQAVDAWEAADRQGLLAMATGSGKTVTALICATRLLERATPLFVVIAAPYRPLVEQWRAEVREFSVTPLATHVMAGTDRDAAVREALRRLDRDVSDVEVAVITHDYLVSDGLYAVLDEVPSGVATLLIADEVHNLGRPRFVERPPQQFESRLGLSATPVLQYNEAGTEALAAFFGETVFEFSLGDAIGLCLVPYNYYLHPVPLGDDELDTWEELTAKLVRAGFIRGDDGTADASLSPEVLALLVKRRSVLEAAAAKVDALLDLLREQGVDRLRHTLVYCSDKRPEQLLAVNRRLLEAGAFVRQLTAEETADRARTAQILNDFGDGHYQVLTCKRVLDEGVDIPQVQQAFLLASSTVRRQWIQRRGRILRRCDAIGKRLAYLHDFLVVPPDPGTQSGQAILRQELERARAFAELAANSGGPDGPFATMAAVTAGDIQGSM
jgi:superfamily II DNA or RNA helicase